MIKKVINVDPTPLADQRIPLALCGLCDEEIYPDDETCRDEDGAFVHLNCDIAESGDFE